MRIPIFAALAVVCCVSVGCTSISCRYAAPAPQDKLPTDLPIGSTLRTKAPLVGLLDESIDNAAVHYLNVVVPPGYRNRFVKQRVQIPEGTSFEVLGYRRPHNPLCRSQDWEVVLGSTAQLTRDRDEIHMRFPLARDDRIIAR